jgi:protein SCO1/2
MVRIICKALLLWLLHTSLALAAGPLKSEVYQFGQAPLSGIGGAINLLDHTGQPFTLQRLAGKPALVFFGFSRCSTACPIALHQIKQVLATFNARPAPPVLFVTLDPLNDDPARLAQYLAAIDPRLLGLTGSPSQVEAVATRYGVAVQAQPGGLDHSVKWYLIGPRGEVARVYDVSTAPAQLAADLRRAQDAAKEAP